MITQSIKLDPETHDRLKALGELRRSPPQALIRAAIRDYLDREESFEREKREDAERLQRYRSTDEAVSHEEAAAWLRDLAAGKDSPCPRWNGFDSREERR